MTLNRGQLIRALFAAVGMSVAAMVIVSVRAKINSDPHPTAFTRSQDFPTRSHRGRVQVVRFTLYDRGIIPELAYAQPGLVTIAVEDLSGGTTGLVVERDEEGQTRARIGEVRRNERKRHGKEELRLEEGRYQVYMADRPENRAQLIVEP